MHFYRIISCSKECCNHKSSRLSAATELVKKSGLIAFASSLILLSSPINAQPQQEGASSQAELTRSVQPPDLPLLTPAPAMPEVEGLLAKMNTSFRELNFDISYIRVYQGIIEPKRLSHGVVDGLTISYLSYLNGPPREYVQRGDLISYFEPEIAPYTLKANRFQGSFYGLMAQGPDELKRNYEFVLAGKSRVAGRPSQVVRLIAKDELRYSYQVWLDRNSHLPLRLDVLNQQGKMLEQLMAVSLRTYSKPTPWISELTLVELPQSVSLTAKSDPNGLKWGLGWKPKGFKVIAKDRHRLALTDDAVDYLMISDGIVQVSIYIEPAKNKAKLNSKLVMQGATSLLTHRQGGSEITVVGEIPPETAQRIAESIRPVKTRVVQ